MRNKFVYSCSVKILALGFDKLLECVFCIPLVVEAFSLQNFIEMLEEVVVSLWEVRWMWWMRETFVFFISNSSSFWSTGCATCGWALLWRRTGPILLTNTGCRRCSFQCLSLICWAHFSDAVVSLGFRKLWWIRQAADHQTVTMTLFWCKSGLGKCFGAPSRSNHWAGHHQLSYKSPFSSHHHPVEKRFVVVA